MTTIYTCMSPPLLKVIFINLCPLFPRRLHIKLDLIGQAILEKKRFENNGHINVFLSIWSFAASFFKFSDYQFSPFEHIGDQIGPCLKIDQGQPRVIIHINFVELESPMLHAKFQDHKTICSGVQDF